MQVTIQIDQINKLEEIVMSNCDGIRFGSEFCMWKIPTQEKLKQAYEITTKMKKEFTYITPKVSNRSLKLIKQQFTYLNQVGFSRVVVNDFGVLNILNQYPNLQSQLGRQLVYMPARCPWLKSALTHRVGFFERRHLEKIYYQTSLNYKPSIELYQQNGINRIDVDWIPQAFQYFDYLLQNNLSLSMYTHVIPVGITRNCHTARFLGISEPKQCSQPCNSKAFLLKQKALEIELYLHGNIVFRFEKPSQRDLKKLSKLGVDEVVVSFNPILEVDNQHKIDEIIEKIKS